MLVCQDLEVSVEDRVLVRGLNLDLKPGRLLVILGPNGVGKSLTLHTLAGLRRPARGEVHLEGQNLNHMKRGDIARRLGMLLQRLDDRFPQTVFECALMGSHPRSGFLSWGSGPDRNKTHAVLKRLDLHTVESQLAMTLSGGERRRLGLATLLVQDPDIMLLDEPTGYLDPHHQLQVLKIMRDLANAGKTIVASLHDPALASEFADDVLLLRGDGNWGYGSSAEMLTTGHLQTLYDTPFFNWSRDDRSVLLPV